MALSERFSLERLYAYLQWLGLIALSLMAGLTMITDKFGGRAGKAAIVIGCLLVISKWRTLIRSPLAVMLVIAVAIQLFSWLAMQWHYPDWAEDSPKLGRLAAWFTFIPIALLLAGERWRIAMVLGLFALSLFISPWIMGGGLAEISRGLAGQRVDFGVRNAQHVAMMFGVIFIASLGLLITAFTRSSKSWIQIVLYLVMVLLSFGVVVITQTRAVWLALMVVVGVLLIVSLVAALRNRTYIKQFSWLIIVLVALGVGISQSPIGETFIKRYQHESQNIMIAFSGSADYRVNTSTGIRLETWRESLTWIGDRPFLGWGGNGRDLVIKHADRLTDRNKQNFRHLHNSYLDTLVNYGVFGLVCLISIFGYLALIAWRLYGSNVISLTTTVTLGSILVFFVVVNCFESYMFYSSGKFVLGLLGGAILSLYWKTKKAIL